MDDSVICYETNLVKKIENYTILYVGSDRSIRNYSDDIGNCHNSKELCKYSKPSNTRGNKVFSAKVTEHEGFH